MLLSFWPSENPWITKQVNIGSTGKRCDNLEIIVSGDTKLAAIPTQNLFSSISKDEAKIWVFPDIKNVLIMENIFK